MSRAGRRRKSGHRHASGDLVRERAPSPLMIAAAMPHRQGLGEAALDQRAEGELGRMCLQGKIFDHQYDAGQRYIAVVNAYRSTIKPPHGFESGDKGYTCRGDNDCPDCECRRRRVKYDQAYCALLVEGYLVLVAVNRVAIQDQPCPAAWRKPLNLGLTALARHFGLLTNGRKSVFYENIS